MASIERGIPGRPPAYTDSSKVFLSATGKSKLQTDSDRRAIVNLLVDSGGVLTLGEINASFGFDIRERVFALQKAGWVRIEVAR
jgi:hypothetical protein